MKTAIVLSWLTAALAACGLDDALHRMDIETFKRQCTDFGFAPGTTEFAQCMQKQSIERDRLNQDIVRQSNQDQAKKK